MGMMISCELNISRFFLVSIEDHSDRAADKTYCPVDSFQRNAIIFQKHVTFLFPMLSNRVKGPNRKEV